MEIITDGLPLGWEIVDKYGFDRSQYELTKDGVFLAYLNEYDRSGLEWVAYSYATSNKDAIAKINAVLADFRRYEDKKQAAYKAAIDLEIETERSKKETDALRVLM